MFALQGVVVTQRRPELPYPGDLAVASLGFVGEHVRGCVTIAARPAIWRAVAPAALAPALTSDAMLSDIVAELSNMLFGRLRNALSRLGVVVACATPITTTGRFLDLPRPPNMRSEWHTFQSEFGEIYVRFDAAFLDGFELPAPNAGIVEPVEAELVNF